MKKPTAQMFFLVSVFVLIAAFFLVYGITQKTYEAKALGSSWTVTTTEFEFKRVTVGMVKNVPIRRNRWRSIQTYNNTGLDNEPVPATIDCNPNKPEEPALGDKYCAVTKTTYYLLVGTNWIQVDGQNWALFNEGLIDSVTIKETLFGLSIVNE